MTPLVLFLVAAPLVIGLLAVCLRNPMTIALPAFAILMPFGGLISIGASRFGSLSSLLGLVLGLGLLLQFIGQRKLDVRMSATVPLWLLFLATAGATALWSVAPQQTETGFLVLGSLVMIFVLVSLNRTDRDILRRVENGLIIGGVLCVLYGLTQFLFLGGFPSDGGGAAAGDGRFGNDLLGPNNQAVAVLLPLLISLSRLVTRPSLSSRAGNALISLLLLTGIVLTGSRGGILATGLAVVVLAMANRRGRLRLLEYAAVGTLLVAFVWFTHPFGIAEREVETTSSSGRTSIWRVGAAACPQYCLHGSGWETFPDVYAATQAKVPGAEVLVGKGGSYQPHNVWLLVAIELGLPGLVLLASVLLLTFVEALRLPARLRGPPLAGFVATLFAALFLSNLEFKFFWMALIMVTLSRNVALAEADPRRRADADDPSSPDSPDLSRRPQLTG